MQSVKLRLENEELQPVLRLARQFGVEPEDLAYAGLDLIMQQAADPAVQAAIVRLKSSRKAHLPSWADRSREIHAYESMT